MIKISTPNNLIAQLYNEPLIVDALFLKDVECSDTEYFNLKSTKEMLDKLGSSVVPSKRTIDAILGYSGKLNRKD